MREDARTRAENVLSNAQVRTRNGFTSDRERERIRAAPEFRRLRHPIESSRTRRGDNLSANGFGGFTPVECLLERPQLRLDERFDIALQLLHGLIE